MLRSWMISVTAAMFLIPGCGDSGERDEIEQWIADTKPLDLHQAERVQEAAQNSDPLSMSLFAILPVIELGFLLEESPQTDCPRLTDASDPVTGLVDWRIEGDCSWEDENGQHRVEGSIVAQGDENGTELVYDGYRKTMARADLCNGQETEMAANGVVLLPGPYMPFTPDDSEDEPDDMPDGPVDLHEQRFDIHVFLASVDVDPDTCVLEKNELAYDVIIDRTLTAPDSANDADLSDIRGSVAVVEQSRESVQASWQTTAAGAWRVTSDDYGAKDGGPECPKYITGTLRLEAGGDEAVLQPEAPGSCVTDEQDVCTAWSLNGKPQPEMCGFVGLSGCSAGPDAPPPWTAMILLVGGLIWQTRRRRQRA